MLGAKKEYAPFLLLRMLLLPLLLLLSNSHDEEHEEEEEEDVDEKSNREEFIKKNARCDLWFVGKLFGVFVPFSFSCHAKSTRTHLDSDTNNARAFVLSLTLKAKDKQTSRQA